MVFRYKFRARFGFRIVAFNKKKITFVYNTNQPHVQ